MAPWLSFGQTNAVPAGRVAGRGIAGKLSANPGERMWASRLRRGRSIEKDPSFNMDAQDARDNQTGRLLHERLTPATITCGFADVQEFKPAVSRKILCILCIHVNKPSTHARL